jgi:DNA-binding transcriptional MerR regulator
VSENGSWSRTVAEVCELVGITPRAVRYYELRGLISAQRDGNNARRFTEETRQRLEIIAKLRRAGLSLEDIGTILEVARDGSVAQTAIALERLHVHLEGLTRLQRRAETVIAEVANGGLLAGAEG